MKFKNSILGLFLLTPSIIFAAHSVQRKSFITDIVNKSGVSVTRFPTALPTSNRAAMVNSDGEITNSSVSDTELTYLDNVTSDIQAQLDAKAVYPIQTGNSGKYLTTNGSVTSWGTVSASPGGSTTQVQFNDASAFGGDASFVWDKTNHRLGIGNSVTPAGLFHLDALNSAAFANMFQVTHGTQTGVTATDGFVAGFPTGSSSDFYMTYLENATFRLRYGVNTMIDSAGSQTRMCFGSSIACSSGYWFEAQGTGLSVNGAVDSSNYSRFAIYKGWGVSDEVITGDSTMGPTNQGIIYGDTTGGPITTTLLAYSRKSKRTFVKYGTSANKWSIIPNAANLLNNVSTAITLNAVDDSVTIDGDSDSNNQHITSDTRAPRFLSITANTTLTPDNKETIVVCNATSAGGDVLLIAYASAARPGWKIKMKNIGTLNNCVFDPNGSELVDNVATDIIYPGIMDSAEYDADGTGWWRF